MTEKAQTIGERYEPAMKIEQQAEADQYFEKLVQGQLEAATSFAQKDGWMVRVVEIADADRAGRAALKEGGK